MTWRAFVCLQIGIFPVADFGCIATRIAANGEKHPAFSLGQRGEGNCLSGVPRSKLPNLALLIS